MGRDGIHKGKLAKEGAHPRSAKVKGVDGKIH